MTALGTRPRRSSSSPSRSPTSRRSSVSCVVPPSRSSPPTT
ncbi:hypothetical protein ACRAWF_15680 [Streptomyces sp. L7]